MANEFLGMIRIAIDTAQASRELRGFQHEVQQVSEKQYTFPGFEKVPQSLKQGKVAVQDVRRELAGFTAGLSKSVPIFDKAGTVVGTKMVTSFRNAEGITKNLTTQFDRGNKVTRQFISYTGQASRGMGDFEKAMRRALIVAPVWMALRWAMQSVLRLIASQAKFLKDLEDAMARIKIVGKGTAEEYDNLRYSLLGLALAYGVSASEAAEAAKIFAQQGKTVSETVTLTRTAMAGAQVLGKSVKEVVEDLTAAMKAYNISAENASFIIDRLINVEKQFAVTSKDLASGIKRTGATANQVGVSLAALVGDITAVIEVTRRSGESTARGLQFIYARLLTTAKPVIEQLTGIKFYLDEQGKSTAELTGRLRNATDILDELARKWGTLTNEQKLNIAVATGSKRQLVVLNALMQNYAHSIDARIAALTSAGEAEKALAIIQDTVTYKTKVLASAWNSLTVAVADTSVWKGLLDIFADLAIGLTSIINREKAFRIILAQQASDTLTAIETNQAQISSLEELIALRDKLLAEPPADLTSERLEKINKAIETITRDRPEIRAVLTSGTSAELKAAVQEISDQLLREKISAQVGVEFLPEIITLRERKTAIEESMAAALPIARPLLFKKEMKDVEEIDRKILELTKKQTAEEEKQLALAKAQRIEQEIVDEEEQLRLTGQLTEKQKEQLRIEEEMIRFTTDTTSTLEEQIEKRIELVRNSKFMYDAQEKVLELEKLQNELLDARLKKRDDERKKVENLLFQYEQADAAEKARILRQIELINLAKERPEEVIRAFEETPFDRDIILRNIKDFPEEVGKRIAESIAREAGQYNLFESDEDIILNSLRELERLSKITGREGFFGGVTDIATPEITNQPTINNNFMVDIELQGAITDENIQDLLKEIEDKLKGQSNYVGSESDLLEALKNATTRKGVAKILRPEL